MKKIRENDLEKNELTGPVRQVKQTAYEPVKRAGVYVPGPRTDQGFENTITTFSRAGIATAKVGFGHHGVTNETRYTPSGRIGTIVGYTKDGGIDSVAEYSYNEHDLIVQTRTDHPGRDTKKCWISTHEYDGQNFLVAYTCLVDGRLHSRQAYRLNSSGETVEQWMFDENDVLDRRIERTYNKAGQLESEKNYDGKGTLTTERAIHYSPDGKCIGATENGSYKSYEREVGRPNEYEYDHHGNWIKEVDYEYSCDDKPEAIRFRSITYYDEPSGDNDLTIEDTIRDMATLHHPIRPAPVSNLLNATQWQWVAEGSTKTAPFSIQRYYIAANGFFPSCADIYSYETDLWALRRHLIKFFGAAELFKQSTQHGNSYSEQFDQYILSFPQGLYILEATDIQHLSSYHYGFAETPADKEAELADSVQFGTLNLYYPAGSLGERDDDFEDELDSIVSSFRVKKKEEVPQISMITMQGPSFSLKAFPVKDDFLIADLDLHYGNGFEKFNDDLMAKFRSTKQGLILFHGEPGTGKTFYMRHLLRKMSESKKVVIYMPPNMVDHLADPGFLTFISGKMSIFAASGKSCIMLIEDAEPLLVARDESTRIQGITNLLNMTDGLLNDMLGLQIICTFNVPLKQLDQALLRPGRLIARKEFKALPEFEANVLAHSLGIKHVFREATTLGEIYSKAAGRQMLTHDA